MAGASPPNGGRAGRPAASEASERAEAEAEIRHEACSWQHGLTWLAAHGAALSGACLSLAADLRIHDPLWTELRASLPDRKNWTWRAETASGSPRLCFFRTGQTRAAWVRD